MNYIISVCRPEAAAVFGDICSELCLPLSIKLYGRGTAVQSMLDILGIESAEKRVFITVADREKTKQYRMVSVWKPKCCFRCFFCLD